MCIIIIYKHIPRLSFKKVVVVKEPPVIHYSDRCPVFYNIESYICSFSCMIVEKNNVPLCLSPKGK